VTAPDAPRPGPDAGDGAGDTDSDSTDIDSTDSDYGQFPLRSHLGLDVAVTGWGTATASLVADQRHLNPNSVVHGAVLFALADTAMGAAAMTAVPAGGFCASVEVHLRFLAPAMAGDLVCDVAVDRAGKRIIHLSGRINDASGATVASATGTFAVIAAPAG
jgi:acyl-CoA thioesterase